VAITRDGSTAISGSADKKLHIWDLKNGAVIGTLEGHTGPVNAVDVTPDGATAVSASDDMTLRLWDLASNRQFAAFRADYPLRCVAVVSRARFVTAGDSGVLHVLDLWE
jgi:WD40 repeat protein